MKTIQDLQNIVTEALENAGFARLGKDCLHSDGTVYARAFSRDGDTWTTVRHSYIGYDFTELHGKEIYIETVYRSNGTEEDRSIRIEVTRINGTSGFVTYRKKIYGKNGDKKIQNVIAEAIAAYEEI